MTTFLAVIGVWLTIATGIAYALGRAVRAADTQQPTTWNVPDDLAGLQAELDCS